MGEVLKFPEKKSAEADKNVWQCTCGYSSFKLYEDGTIKCWECDTEQYFCHVTYGDKP